MGTHANGTVAHVNDMGTHVNDIGPEARAWLGPLARLDGPDGPDDYGDL
jgi:hypothetical protein